MVSRNKIPKEIRRQGAGPVKIGKGTSVKDIKRMRKDWEEAPMKGTAGPYNPQKMRLKKKKDTSVKVKKLPTSRKQAMSPAEREKLIGLGVNPKEIKGTVEYKKWQREKDRAAKQTPATLAERGYGSKKRVAKTGGTVRRKKGSTVKRNHGGKIVTDGNKYVANLYEGGKVGG